jgi:hypothetical protein
MRNTANTKDTTNTKDATDAINTGRKWEISQTQQLSNLINYKTDNQPNKFSKREEKPS